MNGDKTLGGLLGDHLPGCRQLTERELERSLCRGGVKRNAADDDSTNTRPMKFIRRDLKQTDYKHLRSSDIVLVSMCVTVSLLPCNILIIPNP